MCTSSKPYMGRMHQRKKWTSAARSVVDPGRWARNVCHYKTGRCHQSWKLFIGGTSLLPRGPQCSTLMFLMQPLFLPSLPLPLQRNAQPRRTVPVPALMLTSMSSPTLALVSPPCGREFVSTRVLSSPYCPTSNPPSTRWPPGFNAWRFCLRMRPKHISSARPARRPTVDHGIWRAPHCHHATQNPEKCSPGSCCLFSAEESDSGR